MHAYVQTREVIPRPKVLLTSYENARKILREVIGKTSTDHKVFQLELSRTILGAFDIHFCTGPHTFSRYIHFLDVQRNVSTQALEETVHSMEEWIKTDTLKAWEELRVSFLESIQMPPPVITHNVPRTYFHNVNSTVVQFQDKILLDINPCRVMAVIWKEAQPAIDPINPMFMECLHMMGEQVESVQIAFFDSEVASLLSSCYSHNARKTHYEKETLYYNPDAIGI